MVEDVLVKVDKFIFLMDFVVMFIEEDNEVPLILNRPFMKTTRVIVDVDEGKLKTRAQDNEATFNIFYGLKHSNAGKDFLQTDTTKEASLEAREQLDLSNVLEKVIHHCTSKAKQMKRRKSLYQNL